jgi:spore germination cell wall hydrolase CwlJ-like protein
MGGSMFRNAFLIVLMLLALLVGDYHPVPVMERKPISKVVLDEKQLTCLAKNIFYEAPMESYRGKLAVATVTMNRVRHKQFPKTICGVVYQRNSRGCQFSWTCGPKAPFDSTVYQVSYEIAKEVLTNNTHVVILKNAMYFHNTSVKPGWTFAKPITQIGNHIFYEPL